MFPTILEERMPHSGARLSHGDDSALRIKFFYGLKYLPEQSRIEERDCFDENIQLEYIEIKIPGGDTIVRVVTPDDKKRFSEKYRQWKLNEGESLGTPLDVLGFTNTQKDMCTRANIFSVEQLASVGDSVLQQVGLGATNMKRRACDFISSKPVQNDELEALKKKNEELTKALNELVGVVKELKRGK